MTLTLDSYGDSNVDSSDWIDIAFDGDVVGVSFFRLDQVFDPKHLPAAAPELCDICYTGGKLIDSPKDFASWLAKLPGVTVVSPARTVRVGGLDATQLDVRCSRDVWIGPLAGLGKPVAAGLGPFTRTRLIAVTVGGRQVLIAMARGESGVEAFDTSMKTAQPMIDSIAWH